jgi:hypothetical protein
VVGGPGTTKHDTVVSSQPAITKGTAKASDLPCFYGSVAGSTNTGNNTWLNPVGSTSPQIPIVFKFVSVVDR